MNNNKNIVIVLSLIKLDEHVSKKISTFRIYKGVLGSRINFRKIKQNGGFSLLLFFFAFW